MNTLLLRLSGPMQSWGVQSRFSMRDTGLEPSKSGVIGLLCAALGRGRQLDLEDLAGLRLGVRADREGRLSRDYHTATNVLKASGGIKATEPSTRYYLSDAIFLVGLESDNLALLEMLKDALENPVWPVYLGRKAFIPGESIVLDDGLKEGIGLEDALSHHPYIGRGQPTARLRLVIEDPKGEQVRPDQPISFAERTFSPRHVKTIYITTPALAQENL